MNTRHWRIALIVWVILIFVASSGLLSSDNTEKFLVYNILNYAVRKLAHIAEYAVLVFLGFRSLWTKPKRFAQCLIWSVVLSILYAASDEWHQSFVPNRLGIWTDVVWDAAGAILAGIGLYCTQKWGSVEAQRRLLGSSAVGE